MRFINRSRDLAIEIRLPDYHRRNKTERRRRRLRHGTPGMKFQPRDLMYQAARASLNKHGAFMRRQNSAHITHDIAEYLRAAEARRSTLPGAAHIAASHEMRPEDFLVNARQRSTRQMASSVIASVTAFAHRGLQAPDALLLLARMSSKAYIIYHPGRL